MTLLCQSRDIANPRANISHDMEEIDAERERKRKRIKIALIVFTVVALVLFLGIFAVFVLSIKDMN